MSATGVFAKRVTAIAALLVASGCRSTPKGLEGPRDDANRAPAKPSAGCKAPRKLASGEFSIDAGGHRGVYFLSVPRKYDGTAPVPLLFAFHGRTRTHLDCRDSDCRGFLSEMKDHAVIVFLKSVGEGWEGPGEREPNLAVFDALLGRLRAEACIDEARLFAAGTSSGAHFTNLLACRNGDILRAVAPIAGALQDHEGCKGSPAALVVHGVDDRLVPFANGASARDFYRARNGCSASVTTPIPDLHTRVVNDRESHECTEFQNCRDGAPVAWCEHSEGGYDGSTHGCPGFAGAALRTFFGRF